MGVLSNAKKYLAQKAVTAAQKAGDGISALSALSPKQLQDVEEKRAKYLSGMPDMTGEQANLVIQKNLGAIGIEIYQAYLDQLETIYSPVDISWDTFDVDNRIRFFDITKWVTDSEEQNLDKLVNVYHVLSEEDCTIALIYHRTSTSCNVAIGISNKSERDSDPAIADKFYSRMVGAVSGNFPGSEIKELGSACKDYGIGIPACLHAVDNFENGKNVKSVAVVSNVASEKSEDFISQSMEKLLDGIVPKREDGTEDYTVVLLANPIWDQLESKNRLYELYSALAPYSSWQTGYTYTESDGISSSASFGVNLGVSAGAHSVVNSTVGTSDVHTIQKGSSDSGGAHLGGKHFGVDYHRTWNRGVSDAAGTNETQGVSSGFNASANFGVSFSRSSNVSALLGKNESLTQTFTNYGIKHTLEIIDSQLKRIEESAALGMWEFAAYVISDSPVIANNVAHMYLALTQGEESFLTRAAVNFWDGDIDADKARTILSSVQRLQHPVFGLKSSLEDEWLMYPTLVTPTTPLSGKELAKALNFPRKSVSGLPVIESASFGREVHRLTEKKRSASSIDIGSVYHLCHKEPGRISLDLDSLRYHTLIAGSTGSGKSNTVYLLLQKLRENRENKVKFLVIEPAKGEYKDIFGGYKDDVRVFGTNPLLTPLLQINPFAFPHGIHVLEHIDRLVEIFNACWPMYAAMPAVLKDAVELCYIEKGWDMANSCCEPTIFPTMFDLLDALPRVLKESSYSSDTKSDYTGALITRVKSLTNGIFGQVFCSETTAEDEGKLLFDANAIVDLSRVGSAETKSLIMGILVMKLQEFRLYVGGMDLPLKHVTVLEEAHNLLRRTSFAQTQESSNVQGKSVEMIANAIAEMRTYGEGFIIVDQAPGLLDESVIRNTNTKIILRLPDVSDREIVGRSEALNDNQIRELAKLPQGVAAVYQNDWIEAVLCQFDEFPKNLKCAFTDYNPNLLPKSLGMYFSRLFISSDQSELAKEDVDRVKDWIRLAPLSSFTKALLNKSLNGESLNNDEVHAIAYNVFDGSRIAKLLEKATNEPEGIKLAKRAIYSMYRINNELLATTILRMALDVIFKQLEPSELERRYRGVELGGRIM